MRAAVALAVALMSAAPAAGQTTHLIVVSGLGGEARYSETFHGWAATLIEAATTRWAVPTSNIVYLAEKPDRDPELIDDRSTKVNVEQTLREMAVRAGPEDQIFIVLIGHGSTRDGEPRFNLPGPDMTATDFGLLLDGFPTQQIVFVNAASASGDFIATLSGANRTIITATKSGRERNETIFAGFFVEAYAEEGADADKDERISALEAFEYARREVARVYEEDGRLLSEHAMLDDNGDGAGSGEPGMEGEGDGRLAHSVFMTGETAVAGGEVPADPKLAALYEERRALERQVAELRGRKNEMSSEAYERELEQLLVELALKSREIRALEERGR